MIDKKAAKRLVYSAIHEEPEVTGVGINDDHIVVYIKSDTPETRNKLLYIIYQETGLHTREVEFKTTGEFKSLEQPKPIAIMAEDRNIQIDITAPTGYGKTVLGSAIKGYLQSLGINVTFKHPDNWELTKDSAESILANLANHDMLPLTVNIEEHQPRYADLGPINPTRHQKWLEAKEKLLQVKNEEIAANLASQVEVTRANALNATSQAFNKIGEQMLDAATEMSKDEPK